MGNHHDSKVLDWVWGEIQDTLAQSQHALEAYVENRDDTARLSVCLNCLHQVHGTLQMVELHGGALLTEEMEKLIQAVLDDTVASADEAVEILMQGILQLPSYLEYLVSSQDDFPMALLPLLNDLRGARGESLLSGTSLFKPDLTSSKITVTGQVSKRLQDASVLGQIRKLRQMYQFALAGIIRGTELDAHFEHIQKVIQRLTRLCEQTPRGELWKAASGLVETLQAQVIPVDAAVKSLLQELDGEIRRLTDEHLDILEQPVPETLFNHLLYYIALARDLDSPRINGLRDDYQLDQLPVAEGDLDAAQSKISSRDRNAIHSVTSALNEELTKLKDQLDLFVRSEQRQNDRLEALLPGLRQLANTLAILGLDMPWKVVTEQVELIQKLSAQTDQVDEGTLMDIAGALLYAESSLAGLDAEAQQVWSAKDTTDAAGIKLDTNALGEANGALIRESRSSLEQVKSAIVDFIASQWDTREIEHVPGLLDSIRGGLSLIPLDRVAHMLASAERYISTVLLGTQQVPDWKQLDILADAITSIEYYLEHLTEGVGGSESILQIADDSLTLLGFPVGGEPTRTHTDNDDLIDDDILEIFIEEAGEVLDTISHDLPMLVRQYDDHDALSEVRRAFHTLKGSGRMVGALTVSELAWSVEYMLNRIIDGSVSMNDNIARLLEEITANLPTLIEDFRRRRKPSIDTARLEARAAAEATSEISDAGTTPAIDPELLDIFTSETETHLQTLQDFLRAAGDKTTVAYSDELSRALHTLKGSAHTAGIYPIAAVITPLERFVKESREQGKKANRDVLALIESACDFLAQGVTRYRDNPQASLPGTEAFLETLDHLTGNLLHDSSEEAPSQLVQLFLNEGLDIVLDADRILDHWADNPDQTASLNPLRSELKQLAVSASEAGLNDVAALSDALRDTYDEATTHDKAPDNTFFEIVRAAHEQLIATMDQVAAGLATEPSDTMVAALEGLKQRWTDGSPIGTSESSEALDEELATVFLEEARDLIESTAEALQSWSENTGNINALRLLQRNLHTLKGGARLADVSALGDLSHELETLFEELTGQRLPINDDLFDLLFRCHDRLAGMVESLEARQPPRPAPDLIGEIQARMNNAADEQPVTGAASQAPVARMDEPVSPAPKSVAPPAPPTATSGKQAIGERRTAQETLRVSAPLVDELVNLAGETSITRGRLEQQNSDFSHTLDEMAATIERLREQLRRMEIETETQILFSAEKERGPDYSNDFDPLEMDRYSSIQQLSRALTESSSDLADLQETLSDRVRDTETLLIQQSRINTELQEGLMKTRMIPFASIVPRLRRIVRQISAELGKKVDFDVRNPEGEMDRNILERMIAPLEHMLRNALDHGIENPPGRKQAGKPETGKVTLTVNREGGDVVLRMTDDGTGIPSSVIRDKAINQGMVEEDEQLSEREILQLILQPGFSTAQQVTQISGRGVGMDVVASEIKQLGGSLDIESTEGHGTTFTVRLPFTVSVNRALMVSTGEDFYAIPLNTIEGIVRVSAHELEKYYKPDAPMYQYADQSYRLQYLGNLLNNDQHPKLQEQALPLPVILVRGAEQPLALQVDNIIGSREIVVKSLGPQFNAVRAVSGATILGDGNVVVILDLPAMMRSDVLSEQQRLANLEKARESARSQEQATMVMVVDDSVTVRKVTSRLLERNGMEVITAKDGLGAVAQLQDCKPDIILLDIEMPRMDGFEVASFIRHDDRLQAIPICMITSRSGEKHRERALAIGVNEYLGKPFQETELLETIQRLTRTLPAQTSA